MPIAAKPRDNELRDWVEISLSPRVPDAKARGTPIIEFSPADTAKEAYLAHLRTADEENWAEKARLDALEEHRRALGDGANLNGVYFTAEKFEY